MIFNFNKPPNRKEVNKISRREKYDWKTTLLLTATMLASFIAKGQSNSDQYSQYRDMKPLTSKVKDNFRGVGDPTKHSMYEVFEQAKKNEEEEIRKADGSRAGGTGKPADRNQIKVKGKAAISLLAQQTARDTPKPGEIMDD